MDWRFKPANMRRLGKIRGITWNLRVLNCLLWAKEHGIPILSYLNSGRVAAGRWPR